MTERIRAAQAPKVEIKRPIEMKTGQIEQIGQTSICKFEKAGFITSREIRRFLESLPISHITGITKIEWKPRQPREVLKARLEQKDPTIKFDGAFYPHKREIAIFGPAKYFEFKPTNLFGVLAHEVGHNVFLRMIEKSPASAARYAQAFERGLITRRDFGMVSDYPFRYKDNFMVLNEDFAETYRAYRMNPMRLKIISPEKYEFMRREVFFGKEY